MILAKRLLSMVLSLLMVSLMIGTSLITATALPAQQTAVDWVKAQANSETAYDVDGIYGYQCSDFGTAYINYLIDGNPWSKRYTTYNGENYYDIAYPAGWQKIDNYASFVPQPGDIMVFDGTSLNPNGHVCVAIEGCTTSIYKAVGQSGAQNWRGAHYQSSTYFDSWNLFRGVIRPPFNSGPPTGPTISMNNSRPKIGENVTFTVGANNASGYTIGVDKGLTRVLTQEIGTSFVTNFWPVGNYSSYVTAWNSAGAADSSRVSFTVCPPAPVLTVSSNNSSSKAALFTWNVTDQTTGYDLRVAQNGTTIKTAFGIKDNKYAIQLPPGDYTAWVCSVNNSYTDCWSASSIISFSVAAGDFVPVKTVTYNGHIYSLYDNSTDWSDAKSMCEQFGGHLVSISSLAEQQTVTQLIAGGTRRRYFMGGTDGAAEGVWKWTDGTQFWQGDVSGSAVNGAFENWDSTEPNNLYDYGENHLEILKDSGLWNDTNDVYIIANNNPAGFICEIEPNFTSIASTTYGDSKYYLFDQSLTWKDAEAYCQLMGGHLASITSAGEQTALESLILKGKKANYFIGATCENRTAKDFIWSSGESFSYSNWYTGQPDCWASIERYVVFRNTSDVTVANKWNDVANAVYLWFYPGNTTAAPLGFVCEVPNAPGDINGDEAVDLIDVTLLSRHVAGWQGLTVVEQALDVNGDEVVDLMDVTLLSRYVAGWNVTL